MCQAVKLDIKSETFTESFKKMAKNQAFLMLMFWYSICGALLRIFGAVLGELISINFEVVNFINILSMHTKSSKESNYEKL